MTTTRIVGDDYGVTIMTAIASLYVHLSRFSLL